MLAAFELYSSHVCDKGSKGDAEGAELLIPHISNSTENGY